MVAAKFGKADPDMGSRVGAKGKTKERGDKAMLSASARTPYTGMIGGPSNEVTNKSSKKTGPTGTFAKGGMVSGEGGFRNAAMEHKR